MSGFPFQNAILNIRVKKLKGALQSAPFFHCARRAMRNLGVGVTTREQETALGSMAKRQGKKRNGARTACEGACATKKRRGSGQKGAGRCADLVAVRQKIANHVGGKALQMVRVLTTDAAIKGNLSAMKYLFEMVGLFPASGPQAGPQEQDCLARTLLERLGLEDEVESETGSGRPVESGEREAAASNAN